jgi:hypothetical protein
MRGLKFFSFFDGFGFAFGLRCRPRRQKGLG